MWMPQGGHSGRSSGEIFCAPKKARIDTMTHDTRAIVMHFYATIRRDYLDKVFIPTFQRTLSESPIGGTMRRIGDKNIHIYAHVPGLVGFATRAFAHLPDASGTAPDLTIHVLDSASTGISLDGPWSDSTYGGQERPDSAKAADPSFQGVFVRGEDILYLYDHAARTAYFWIRDAADVPEWMHAAPLRTILHWFFSRHGVHFVHGAAVATENGAVLLSAAGGAGKSTTALSCLASGMDYLGDDYVLIDQDTVHGLYNSVKIVPEQLSRFPEFQPFVWNGANVEKRTADKAIAFLTDAFSHQLKMRAPLTAILIPRIASETRIIPATKLQTMLALVPTTLFQLPLAPASKVSSLTDIIGKTPCFILELGPDVRAVPETIRSFLAAQSVPSISRS